MEYHTENTKDSNKVINTTSLLADLWWLEYQDIKEEARTALRGGDKLKAIGLTLYTHKVKEVYDYYVNRLIFG